MIVFNNSFKQLGPAFYSEVKPTVVSSPALIKFNFPLATELGFNLYNTDAIQLAQIFSGNQIPAGAEPLAMVYAGHQFGSFVPQLGDGRAILLGEVITANNCRQDLQLKGAGKTPYSRRGDGRAALGPVLREYIISEAMHALGIPSTRALAVVLSGENVIREELLKGAIFTRVAASHIRIGTFEYFANIEDKASLKILADYSITRHYPEIACDQQKYLNFLDAVCKRQARLIAKWMQVGFIHGVMNTDNMSISGESIDFGPCAFMDQYNPSTVLSYIDQNGRYAYANQPFIAQWNLSRLAEALLPLLDENEEKAIECAQEILGSFAKTFEDAWLSGMRLKFGLSVAAVEDAELIKDFLDLLHQNKADYTNSFRQLTDLLANPESNLSLKDWAQKWIARLKQEDKSNQQIRSLIEANCPAYIPRNHKVEQALELAKSEDYSKFEEILEVVSKPFELRTGFEEYQQAPSENESVKYTFCGT
jgi:uncharacterized protein YdiU (UPF0061 family)